MFRGAILYHIKNFLGEWFTLRCTVRFVAAQGPNRSFLRLAVSTRSPRERSPLLRDGPLKLLDSSGLALL